MKDKRKSIKLAERTYNKLIELMKGLDTFDDVIWRNIKDGE